MAISPISVTAGGIDVESIVQGLMLVERQPVNRLASRQATAKLQADVIGRLRTSLDALRGQAAAMLSGGIAKLASTVSSSAVTASLSSTARAGTISFTVDRLAQAHGLRTASTVAASTSVVTTAASLAVSSTVDALGISSAAVGLGLPTGRYTVEVTAATTGATATGSAPLGATTFTAGVDDRLELTIGGVTTTVDFGTGTKTAEQVRATIEAAVGGTADVAFDASGRLRITTHHEGSAASLGVAGTAVTALGLTAGTTNGGDGAVRIGTGPVTTVTSAGTGGTLAVPTGSGDLTLTMGGGLRVGTGTIAVVSTGDRSLAAVASAINGANAGVSAAAVRLTDGAWVLQATSTRTGTAGGLSIDGSLFTGGLVETSAAQDAQITVGSGAGAYSVQASGNSFTDVLPGVTLTASAVSATPVTVAVNRDNAASADAVAKLVDAVNSFLADIKVQTRFDPKSKTSSPLTGDANVRRLAEQVRAAVTSIVGAGAEGLAATIGITTERSGQLKFDRAKFTAALDADPASVERLFARGGTGSAGLTFAGAVDGTVAGTYDVQVTTAATRATSGVLALGGLPATRTVGVRIGAVTATYEAAAGATAAEVAAGLNAALASAGLRVNAEAPNGTDVVLTASAYGTAGSFEVNTDVTGAGVWAAHAGTDVEGTIDGRPAAGFGQRLRLYSTDTSPARGLEVDVAGGVTGALTIDYQPGIAARLTALATAATGTDGALTTSASMYDRRVQSFADQIDRYESILERREVAMRRQWAAVQTMLNSLQAQGTWLDGQVAGMQRSG